MNLTVAAPTQQETSRVLLTEVNLNENNQSNSQTEEIINVNLIPTSLNNGAPQPPASSMSADYAIPPASELPSYNEALRLKKQEANEVPPSYYPTITPSETRHIIIDDSEVSFLGG